MTQCDHRRGAMRQNVAGKLSRPLRHRTDTAYDNDMRSLIWAVLAMATTACGGDGGTGTVDVSVWGEEYIEQGIPTSDFADGWTARFDRFLIVIGDVTLENTDGGEASVPGLTLYDLVTLGPHSVGTTDPLEATSWSRVSGTSAVLRRASNSSLIRSSTDGIRWRVTKTRGVRSRRLAGRVSVLVAAMAVVCAPWEAWLGEDGSSWEAWLKLFD